MEQKEKPKRTPRAPKLWEVLVPVVFMMGLIIVCTVKWEIEPHVPILLSCIVAAAMAAKCGYSWEAIVSGLLDSIARATEAILIVMCVGALIGTWVLAGTLPAFVYYGLKILNPTSFFFVGVLLIGLIGVLSGSSWTASGTIGVAFMGIGAGLGVNPAISAGMVISGAYMGDKWSPLSDSTNLAAATAETPLFSHVRAMIATTLPSFVIAMVLYGLIGLRTDTSGYDQSNVDAIMETVNVSFNIQWWYILPVLVIIIGAVKQWPALPTLLGATLAACAIAMIAHGASVPDCLAAMHYGFETETGNETVDQLVNRGGIDSMMWTVSLIMFALAFGGILEKAGFIEAALGKIVSNIKTVGGLVAVTCLTGIACDFILTDQYISILIPGRMYAKYFDEKGLARNFLSRTLEDGATLWSPMCPWNGCGAYQSATLGVPTWQYFPYAFMNLVNPVIAILFSYLGISVMFKDPEQNAKGMWGFNTKVNKIANENAKKYHEAELQKTNEEQ